MFVRLQDRELQSPEALKRRVRSKDTISEQDDRLLCHLSHNRHHVGADEKGMMSPSDFTKAWLSQEVTERKEHDIMRLQCRLRESLFGVPFWQRRRRVVLSRHREHRGTETPSQGTGAADRFMTDLSLPNVKTWRKRHDEVWDSEIDSCLDRPDGIDSEMSAAFIVPPPGASTARTPQSDDEEFTMTRSMRLRRGHSELYVQAGSSSSIREPEETPLSSECSIEDCFFTAPLERDTRPPRTGVTATLLSPIAEQRSVKKVACVYDCTLEYSPDGASSHRDVPLSSGEGAARDSSGAVARMVRFASPMSSHSRRVCIGMHTGEESEQDGESTP
jgi:hypothetical protein